MISDARTYLHGNPNLLKSFAEQTADAQVGGVLLTIGFLGQFASSIGWRPHWATAIVMLPIAFAVDLGGFTFLLWVWRPRGRRRALALIPANERG